MARKKTKKKETKKEREARLDRAKREKEGLLTIEELKEKAVKFTDQILESLRTSFQLDYTVEEACQEAEIDVQTYYNWRAKSAEFSRKMDKYRSHVAKASKINVAKAIITGKSIPDSWEYLKRRQKDIYSDRQEHTGKEGGAIETKFTGIDIIVTNEHKKFEDDKPTPAGSTANESD